MAAKSKPSSKPKANPSSKPKANPSSKPKAKPSSKPTAKRRVARKPVRSIAPPTTVRAEGPPGTIPGLPVDVDGQLARLRTGRIGTLAIGTHSFRLRRPDATFINTVSCPGGHGPANPFVVVVDEPVAAAPALAPRQRRLP